MTNMTWFILALTTIAGPAYADVEVDGVRIRASVRANVYTYELTNLRREPVSKVEIPGHESYRFTVPDGWEYSGEGGVLRAWTSNENNAIKPGDSGSFSIRVSSKGASLSLVRAKVELTSGESIVFDKVWGAVPQPTSYIALVAGGVVVIFALHAWLLTRADRKRAKTTA